MNVDYHVHLEEGPYSIRWWNRTAEALLAFASWREDKHSRDWIGKLSSAMARRVEAGAFSPEWLDLYRVRAKQQGLREVGIVDHLYRFREYKPYYERHIHLGNDDLGRLQRRWLDQVCVASVADFCDFLEQQKERWAADGIRLRVGVEADYFAGGETELAGILRQHAWDHVIGSVHFVDGWGFDNPDTRERFQRENLLDLYDHFFQLMERAVASGLFDILAHPDNIKVFGYRPDETALIPFYRRIAQALKRHDVATEINTGLYYRYPVREMCPSPGFLQVLAEYEVPVTTSSDAHFPDHVGHHLPQARQQLKAAGYKTIATFERRVRKEVEL
ncbi:histidinol phosphate phosphatase domain-containing protein [Effusibacillus pohliae]|uniref:histidinol phosphate phosphatase domain-containing protein n=1 Tax=Effusibacillus pohliae TaxID=232270 RepID=UPI00036AF940|nr:histidinol phosphate phosphatase domain-containing protein [Effusibacillus pohliae]